MQRSLTLELLRVTEEAAMASANWIGYGKKNEADDAATNAMRRVFDTIEMTGTVVIGEGEMDEAPMLYIGERLGCGGPQVDIAVDPLEGTETVAKGSFNAMSVLAAAERGCLLHAPDMYMEKLAVGRDAAGKVDIEAPLEDNVKAIAAANGKSIHDLVIEVLDRKRHSELIQQLRQLGVRIKLIPHGDVASAIHTGFKRTGVDALMGSGGAPEGVLAAVALKCLGGELQGRLLPENEEQVARCKKMGIEDPHKVLRMEDMVKRDHAIFAATGVTEGELLRGIRTEIDIICTHSVVMRADRKTMTVRFIEGIHPKSNLK